MPYGETNPKNILIGLLFSLMMLMLGWQFFAFAVTENPTGTTGFDSEAFNHSINYMTDMQQKINDTRTSLEFASTENTGILGAVGALIQAAWVSIKSLFSTIGYTSQFMQGVSDNYGIPPFIPAMLLSVITIIIVVWIILLVFRRT
jgi:hypothetical protein